LTLRLRPARPDVPPLELLVHYEIADHLPLLTKSLEVINIGAAPVVVDNVTVDMFYFERMDKELGVFTDYYDAYGKSRRKDGAFAGWVRREFPQPIGLPLPPGERFESFRVFAYATPDDADEAALVKSRIFHVLAPWITEQFITQEVDGVKAFEDPLRLPDAAAAGIECVNLFIGQLFTNTGDYRPRPDLFPNGAEDIKRLVAHFHARGVRVVPYCALTIAWQEFCGVNAAKICLDHDDWQYLGPDGVRFNWYGWGNMCYQSAWGEYITDRLDWLIRDLGFDGLHIDGPYHGLPCLATNHKHATAASVPFMNWDFERKLYAYRRERGLYFTVPQDPAAILFGANARPGGYTETDYAAIGRTCPPSPRPCRVLNATGEILVHDAATEQVLRFAADGKRLAAYGQEGGRRDGTYDQTAQESFLQVTALAAAPDGGFLVAEPSTAPRRVARFTADGRFQGEWYGGHVWAPWIAVDPEDPGTVFMPSSWSSIMRLAVDLKNKTWKVRAVHHLDRMADGMLPGHDNARLYRAFRRDGNLYLASCSSTPVVFRVGDSGDRLTPVTLADLHMSHCAHMKRGPIKEWAEAGKDSYRWSDADGDGRAQRGEVQYFGAGPWTCLPEWDAAGMYAVVGTSVQYWPIIGANSAGAPLLGEFPAGKPMLKLPPRVKSIEGRWSSYITADHGNGGWYVAINDSMKDWGHSTDSFVIACNADGTQRWIAGGKTIGTPQSHLAPGDIGCFRRIAGTTHGCVVINDFMERAWPLTSYVWDRDGLWVGCVMDEIDRQAAPVWRYGAGAESLGTTLVNDPGTGDVLLYWHGLNDIRIGRVTGWEGWLRKAGKVRLIAAARATPPALTEVPPGNGKGLLLEFWDQSKPAEKTPAVVRLTDLVNEHWGQGPAAGGPDGLRILGNGRVARVTGEIEAFQTGWHAFRADIYPAKTQYRVAGIELGRYSFNEVHLKAGKRYPVEILYDAEATHPTTDQGIRLQWATPHGTWPGAFTPIPVSQLHALDSDVSK